MFKVTVKAGYRLSHDSEAFVLQDVPLCSKTKLTSMTTDNKHIKLKNK